MQPMKPTMKHLSHALNAGVCSRLTPLLIAMNRVAQPVPAASCGSVPLPARTPGGTPGELAGADACATFSALRFRSSMRELFRGILTLLLGVGSLAAQQMNYQGRLTDANGNAV